MDLQEFKQRLEAQGVDYDHFIHTTIQISPKWTSLSYIEYYLIATADSFKNVITDAFLWHCAAEGSEFWGAVSTETRFTSIIRDVYPTTVAGRCTCELYSLLRDGCKCGGV
jgi:hypothetical protein